MAENSEPGRNLMSAAVKHHFPGVYKRPGPEEARVAGE